MGTMKKKKKKQRPQPATLKRPQRLLKAKHWLSLATQTGKALVHAYAKKYHTGLLCSIVELRMLGVTITTEYEESVKRSVGELTEQKRKKKEEKMNVHLQGIDQDEHFAYIAGYTSGGAPYGLSWDELDEEAREIYSQ